MPFLFFPCGEPHSSLRINAVVLLPASCIHAPFVRDSLFARNPRRLASSLSQWFRIQVTSLLVHPPSVSMPQTPAPSPPHSRHPSVSLPSQSASAAMSGDGAVSSPNPYAELARLSQQVAVMQAHMQQQAEHAIAQQSAVSSLATAAAGSPSIRGPPKIAAPPKFKGEMGMQAENWISALQQQFDYYDKEFVSDTVKLRFAVAYLDQGTALKWFQTLPDPKPASWGAFVAALRSRFSPVEASMVARVSLGRLRQGERNSVSAYTNAYQNLMVQIVDMTVTDQVFHYVTGLLPSLRVRVWEKLPKTLAEAIGYAASYEATIGFAGRAGGFASSASYHRTSGAPSASSSDAAVPMDINSMESGEEYVGPPQFHDEPPAAAASRSNSSSTSASEAALLAKMEAMEHRIAALMGGGGASNRGPSSYKGGDRIPGLQAGDIARLQKEGRCFRCKKVGHMKSECPSKSSSSKSVN